MEFCEHWPHNLTLDLDLHVTWTQALTLSLGISAAPPRHPMPFVCVFYWCNAWEICLFFFVQNANTAHLPCSTNQNKEDKRHGMAGYRPVVREHFQSGIYVFAICLVTCHCTKHLEITLRQLLLFYTFHESLWIVLWAIKLKVKQDKKNPQQCGYKNHVMKKQGFSFRLKENLAGYLP